MSTQSYIHRQGRDKAGETDLGTLERIEVVEVEPEILEWALSISHKPLHNMISILPL